MDYEYIIEELFDLLDEQSLNTQQSKRVEELWIQYITELDEEKR